MSGPTRETGRERVLGAIRSRLGDTGDKSRREAVAARLGGQGPHLVPQRAQQGRAELRRLFAEQLTAANATVETVGSSADVPAAIAAYLRGQNLPLVVRTGDDAYLSALDWTRAGAMDVQTGRAQGSDDVGVTHAVAGVAETGTLVLASGHENPVTITFLPETSIIVVEARHLVGPYESAFDAVRKRFGMGTMPRTLNLVSGPSRTADVGGRLVTGAHGPRRLHVIVVGPVES
jgi:L-lactate dehydrogenase complex protein LldG